MNKNNKKPGVREEKSAPAIANGKPPALPKGFVEASSTLAGFFERVQNNSIQGKLRGSFNVKGKFGDRRVHRIEVSAGETAIGNGETAGEGELVGIDETGYLKKLSDMEQGAEVFIRYLGKKGDDKQDAHVFQVAVPGNDGDSA